MVAQGRVEKSEDGFREWLTRWRWRIVNPFTFLARPNQTRIPDHLEMGRKRRLADLQGITQLADTQLPPPQRGENPTRVGSARALAAATRSVMPRNVSVLADMFKI